MKDKDLVIKTRGGLYVMQRTNGNLCLTNSAHATHYTSNKSARKDFNRLSHLDYLHLAIIDIKKRKRDRGRRKDTKNEQNRL